MDKAMSTTHTEGHETMHTAAAPMGKGLNKDIQESQDSKGLFVVLSYS